ncbi:MAG: AAA family ATPase [Clostridia bacterium]
MFIKKISGTYGIFRNEEFNFHKGLNILVRDNEWGKTTLISLIKVMFYGVNTSARDKKDVLSEKTKYTSNVDFTGEMLVVDEGREISVSRSKSARSSNFQSYYTDVNQKTSYSSSNFGKKMIGVSEEAFVNSALIEADNRLISKNSDLLDLILAMSTTGDVSKSFDKATKTLKDKQQALTKSTGSLKNSTQALQKIENDLMVSLDTEDKLQKMQKLLATSKILLRQKREEYEEKYREASVSKLEVSERARIIKLQSDQIIAGLEPDFYEIEVIEEVKRQTDIFELIEQTEYDLRIKLNHLTLDSMTQIERLNQARKLEIRETSKVKINKIPFLVALIFGVSTVLSMFFTFNLGEYTQYASYILGLLTLSALTISFSSNKDQGNVNIKYDEEIQAVSDQIDEVREKHVRAASKVEPNLKKMLELAKNIGLYDANSKEEVRRRIFFVLDINDRYIKATDFEKNTMNDTNIYDNQNIKKFEKELEVIRSELNILEKKLAENNNEYIRNQIKLDSISPRNQLAFEKDQKEHEVFSINFQISSLETALSVLAKANENLTSRLSPEISKKATEYFAFLTEDRYNSVVLLSDFEAFCKSPDKYDLISKLELSSGTKEQLYFSLRLAICDVLINENAPIILDDPFVFYDDTRTAKAMQLLEKIAEKRQVLLFTCKSFEPVR